MSVNLRVMKRRIVTHNTNTRIVHCTDAYNKKCSFNLIMGNLHDMSGNERYIFLADDDVDDCSLFEDALREVSKETKLTTANDGKELMTKLEDIIPPPPDVIFLDLNMPLMNGYECLAEIRATQKYKNIPDR